MGHVLINALSLLLVILTGFSLKKIGLVKKEDGKSLSNIIVNVTLPAAIIIGLNSLPLSSNFFLLIIIALVVNFILVILAGFIWRKKPYLDKVLFMYTVSGYNIGNFTLPFIQSFYPLAIPFLFMFDVGNCIMIAGGTKIIVEKQDPDGKTTGLLGNLFRTLFSSVPFLTYLIMMLFKVVDITLGTPVITILQVFANANGFLSLLMIGIYLELKLPKANLIKVSRILCWRYLFAAILAAFFYFLFPFNNELVRIVVTILCLAPIPTFAVINSVQAGVESETTGFISSVSILISLVLMTFVMLLII